MATASAKSKQLLAEIAAKKAPKPVPKKPVSASKTAKVAPPPKPVAAAPKEVAPKGEAPKKPTPPTVKLKAAAGRILYTIRLEPELVSKLEARGKKDGVTHAEVARRAIAAYFGA